MDHGGVLQPAHEFGAARFYYDLILADYSDTPFADKARAESARSPESRRRHRSGSRGSSTCSPTRNTGAYDGDRSGDDETSIRPNLGRRST